MCQYQLVKGEVISAPGSLNAANIDLLQFKIPYNDSPPYDLPNHLGTAYVALLTTDLDVAYLKSQSVTLLSEPYGIPGDRFVFFRDPEACCTNCTRRLRRKATSRRTCTSSR